MSIRILDVDDDSLLKSKYVVLHVLIPGPIFLFHIFSAPEPATSLWRVRRHFHGTPIHARRKIRHKFVLSGVIIFPNRGSSSFTRSP